MRRIPQIAWRCMNQMNTKLCYIMEGSNVGVWTVLYLERGDEKEMHACMIESPGGRLLLKAYAFKLRVLGPVSDPCPWKCRRQGFVLVGRRMAKQSNKQTRHLVYSTTSTEFNDPGTRMTVRAHNRGCDPGSGLGRNMSRTSMCGLRVFRRAEKVGTLVSQPQGLYWE